MIFVIKEKCIILAHNMYFLAIATNIPQWLKTAFVVQGHKWTCKHEALTENDINI